ncbi:hypothetical protein TFLX_06205 [Thermoflexales bacterium]|nr:hypothetical protein TFLX_06205 [Thermoflexales bacterium]
MPKSLNCPNCAAPLQVRERQTVALCVYCGSSLKLESEGGMPQPSEQRELTAEVLQQINQLLLDGRRAAAITLYVQEAGVTQTAASEAIDNLATQLTRRTMLRQPISNLGIAIVLGLSGLGLAAFWWGATNANVLIALVGAGWAALQWLAFLPGLVTRWQYETGQAAPAVVRKLIPLGEMKVRGERVSAMRLWLEVRPAGGPVYQAERNVILRQSSLAQLATGSIIEVRGRPDRREAIPVAPLKIVEAKP